MWREIPWIPLTQLLQIFLVSWVVTANIMVKGKCHNHVVHVQFKGIYHKTGGEEDIDFVFQMKDFYTLHPGEKSKTDSMVVRVPGKAVSHQWWNGGNICYSQIRGWVWGDSICLTEWPDKTFLVFPVGLKPSLSCWSLRFQELFLWDVWLILSSLFWSLHLLTTVSSLSKAIGNQGSLGSAQTGIFFLFQRI
jgi:hypothetical protein